MPFGSLQKIQPQRPASFGGTIPGVRPPGIGRQRFGTGNPLAGPYRPPLSPLNPAAQQPSPPNIPGFPNLPGLRVVGQGPGGPVVTAPGQLENMPTIGQTPAQQPPEIIKFGGQQPQMPANAAWYQGQQQPGMYYASGGGKKRPLSLQQMLGMS